MGVPVSRESGPQEAGIATSEDDGGRITLLHGRRLLIVDDSAVNRELAKYILEDAGALVTLARSGLDAVELIRASPSEFDAVLMDIQMPELDGPEATRMIRDFGLHGLPIIALTASEVSGETESALQAGMDRVIAKPLELDALLRVLADRWRPETRSDSWPVIDGLDSGVTRRRFGADRNLFVWALRQVCREHGELERAHLSLTGTELLNRMHKLCGTAGAIGATALSEAARAAHAALEQDEIEGTRIVVNRVGPEIRRLREIVAALGTEPPNSAIEQVAPAGRES
jgi:CheY-like chemotaxis protein